MIRTTGQWAPSGFISALFRLFYYYLLLTCCPIWLFSSAYVRPALVLIFAFCELSLQPRIWHHAPWVILKRLFFLSFFSARAASRPYKLLREFPCFGKSWGGRGGCGDTIPYQIGSLRLKKVFHESNSFKDENLIHSTLGHVFFPSHASFVRECQDELRYPECSTYIIMYYAAASISECASRYPF